MRVSVLSLSLIAMICVSTFLQPSTRAASGTEHGGKIESRYDGFAHETVVALKKMKITCSGSKGNWKDSCVSLAASLHCPGIQLDYVKHAKLQLVFQTKDWDQRHALDQRGLSIVVDGETVRAGRMTLESQNTDTLMTEVLEVTLPYKTFKQIAEAQSVEMKVGKNVFALRAENLLALRDLNNRVMPRQ